MGIAKRLFGLLFRNHYRRDGTVADRNCVNLEYYRDDVNLGDSLAPVIYSWMLARRQLEPDMSVKSTIHLMTIGSIIGGRGMFDATVWGSGIKSFSNVCTLSKSRYFQVLDIRAVRGPITRCILQSFGYDCPDNYGDPGVLLPLIYDPRQNMSVIAKKRVCLICHFRTKCVIPSGLTVDIIDIKTENYGQFVDKIVQYEKVISSSLHGIILAESYGVPAVFLAADRDVEMMKYYDWYYSTGRYSVNVAMTIEEAIAMKPMELPNLAGMQDRLLKSFPYDLWE